MTATRPPRKAPAEAGAANGLKVSLRDHLPRMLTRLELMPDSPERDRAQALVRFVQGHWEQYTSNEQRKTQVLGCALFVGEVEHLARMDDQLEADRERKARQAEGGRNKGSPDWHAKCLSAAEAMLSTGTQPHELASKLARRFQKDRKTVSALLRKAGVK